MQARQIGYLRLRLRRSVPFRPTQYNIIKRIPRIDCSYEMLRPTASSKRVLAALHVLPRPVGGAAKVFHTRRFIS
jgi:hypothetical protein